MVAEPRLAREMVSVGAVEKGTTTRGQSQHPACEAAECGTVPTANGSLNSQASSPGDDCYPPAVFGGGDGDRGAAFELALA